MGEHSCRTRCTSSTSSRSPGRLTPNPPTSVSPRSRRYRSLAHAYGLSRRAGASSLLSSESSFCWALRQVSHTSGVVPSCVVRHDWQNRSSHLLQKLEQPLQIEQEQPWHIHVQSLQKRSSHRSQVEYSSSLTHASQPWHEMPPFHSSSE